MNSTLRRRGQVSWAFCLWSSLFALMMSLILVSTSQAQAPLDSTRIAFTSNRGGSFEIFIANIDGTNPIRLTTGGGGKPSWSPDGKKIAFHLGNPVDIYVVNADGSNNPTRLTTAGGGQPTWSPDGTKIAFSSGRNGNHIWVMNADGTNQTQVTTGSADDSDPAWSPDGTKIAFGSFRNNNWDIYVMHAADGSNQTRLTTDPAVDQGPSWSPDGTQIAFFSSRIGSQYDIYKMSAADGSNQTRLTTDTHNDYNASWAPDGTKIAFESTRAGAGTATIYVMNPDGSGQTRILSTPPGIDSQPAWSPFLIPPGNRPPVANAGLDQMVECTSHSGTPVTLNGTGSSDPDGDPLTYTWTGPFGTVSGPTPTVTLSLGTYTITLTVNDGKGGTASDQVMITVHDTTPPTITLNGANPLTLECPAPYNEPGASVNDACDPAPSLVITGAVDSHTPGDYTITYTATDASGNSETVTRTVKMQDTTPPTITLKPSRSLWPPNHKYVTITIDECVATVVDACAGNIAVTEVVIESASSDEPEDAVGNGDGSTLNDIVIAPDGKSVQLRMERQGAGNGRVYTLNLAVKDPSGNKATATCKMTVPHDQGSGSVAVDDGPAYTVGGVVLTKVAARPPSEAPAGSAEKVIVVPTAFTLGANVPNPFNPTTRIAYDVPQATHVTLAVYNLLGQEVVRLVDAQQAPGRYLVTWDGRNASRLGVASGVYLYRLTTTAGFSQTRRMTLVK